MDAGIETEIRLLYRRDYCPLDRIAGLAVGYLKQAEYKGDAESLYRLSECYDLLALLSGYVGNPNMRYDASETSKMLALEYCKKYRALSSEYYEKALAANEPHACFCEYERLLTGVEGNPRDGIVKDSRAMNYLRIAADQGHPMAMYQLSKHHRKTKLEGAAELRRRAMQYDGVREEERMEAEKVIAESRRRSMPECGPYDSDCDDVREDMGPRTNWPDRG